MAHLIARACAAVADRVVGHSAPLLQPIHRPCQGHRQDHFAQAGHRRPGQARAQGTRLPGQQRIGEKQRPPEVV
jgi:hypothetical protein